jgi:hypothetical protein
MNLKERGERLNECLAPFGLSNNINDWTLQSIFRFRGDLCFYHFRWGTNAQKCKEVNCVGTIGSLYTQWLSKTIENNKIVTQIKRQAGANEVTDTIKAKYAYQPSLDAQN